MPHPGIALDVWKRQPLCAAALLVISEPKCWMTLGWRTEKHVKQLSTFLTCSYTYENPFGRMGSVTAVISVLSPHGKVSWMISGASEHGFFFFFFTALNSKLLLKQFLTTGEFEDLCIGSDLFSLLAPEPQVLMVHVIPLYRSRLYCYHPVLILFWVISSWKLLVILAGIHWMLGLESLLAVWKCILTTRLVCFKHLHCLCSC